MSNIEDQIRVEDQIRNEIVTLAYQHETSPTIAGPVPEVQILAAEHLLGVKFPLSYRIFLKYFGAAQMMSYHICGLPPLTNLSTEQWHFLNVVGNTIDLQIDLKDIPKDYVYVTDDNGSLYFWLKTSIRSDDGESPVVGTLYGREYHVANTFLEFVRLLPFPESLYSVFAGPAS